MGDRIPPPPQGPPPLPGPPGGFDGPPSGPPRPNGPGGGAIGFNDGKPGGGNQSQQVFATTYQGWTLRKADPEPGQRYDWTRVNITEFPVSTRDMALRAKQSRKKHSVLEVYDALKADSQRSHIDRLIEERNGQEQNVWAEWKLANIEVIRKTIPGIFGSSKVIETTQLRVILKKVPRDTPKKKQQKPPKANNFAGEVVDLYEPPLPAAPAGKKDGGGGGAGPMGPMGGGVDRRPPPPPGGFPPPGGGIQVMGSDFDHRDELNGRGRRRHSPGPRSSAEKLNKKVLKYLERMGIADSENDSDDFDEVDGRRGRKSKYKLPPPPMGRHSRRRSKSPFVNNRRNSASSFEMIDYAESSSSGQYTDATPPLSADSRHIRRYLDRSRSRSRGRFRLHGKPPGYPLPGEPVVVNNYYGDTAKDPLYLRRHSDGDRSFVPRHPAALPAAPDVPLYGYNGVAARPQSYMDPISRRATYAGDDVKRELDAFQKGRDEERRANLEARVQELKRQEEASLRRIDDLRRVEDGVRWRRDSEREVSPRERVYSGGFSRR